MNAQDWLLAWKLVPIELWNTLYMVLVSTLFAVGLGTPLGVLLVVTRKGHLAPNPKIHWILGSLTNIGRSFPFVILMVAIIPFTRWLVGTSLGTTAAIIPLTIAAIPSVARMVENALGEVDHALIEAASVMGCNIKQIILKVLFPEALPALILGVTTIAIHLIGYSAMAGTMGGGGLGKIAVQYGYQRFNPFLICLTVILLIVIVQLIQWVGNRLYRYLLNKRGKIHA